MLGYGYCSNTDTLIYRNNQNQPFLCVLELKDRYISLFFFFWTHPPLGDLHFFVLFVFVFIIFDPTSVSANYLLSQLELT